MRPAARALAARRRSSLAVVGRRRLRGATRRRQPTTVPPPSTGAGPGRSRRPSARRAPRSRPRSAQRSLVLSDSQAPVPAGRGAAARRPRRAPSTRSSLPEDPDQGLHRRLRVRRPGARGRGRRRAAGATSRPARAGSRRPQGTVTSSAASGTTVVLYDWLPGAVDGSVGAPGIQTALETLGIGVPGRELSRRPRSGDRQRRVGRDPGADRVALDLERVRAREVLLRPEPPAGDPLVRAERRVGRLDRGIDRRGRRRVASPASRRVGRTGRPTRGRPPRSGRAASRRTTESRMPAIRSAFSMSSGYTLNPLGRTMMSLVRPDRMSRPAVVEVADVAGLVPAVLGEGRGGRLGRRASSR